MATIGSLTADLTTNVASFTRDMGKAGKAVSSNSARMNRALGRAERSFKRTTRAMGRMARNAVGLRSVVGTLAGTAGLGLLIKRSIDVADSIVKTADKVGLLTGELQDLRFAAEQTGVSQRTLDLGIQRFSRRVGEAAQGAGELKGTLDDYGISLRDAEGRQRRLTDVLADYADAIAGAESEQEQLRLAFKGFDSEGAALVNTLRNGSEGLRELARQAPKAIPDKLLRNAARAKDQLNLLARTIDVQVTTAVLGLAPQIESLSKRLLEGLPTLIKWVEQFGLFVGLIDRSPAGEIARLTEKIGELQKRTETNVLGFSFENKFVKQQIAALERQLELQRELIRGRALTGLPVSGGAPAGGAAAAPGGARTLGGAPIPGKKPTEELAALVERMKTIEDQAKAVFDATRTPQENFAARMVTLNDLVDQGAISQDTYARAVKQAQDELSETGKVAEQVAQATGDLAVDAINGQIKSWQDLGRVALNVIGSILRAQLRAVSAGGGGGGIGALFAALGAGAGAFAGGAGPAAGSFRAAQTIPARQAGGPVSAGKPFLVGEAGPEVFVPALSGQILPSGGGLAGPVFNVDMRGASAEAVAGLERLVAQVNGSIEERAVAAVQERNERAFLFGQDLG